jgi:UDP-N-acetylmuramoylalanine--D-glutamate ligase
LDYRSCAGFGWASDPEIEVEASVLTAPKYQDKVIGVFGLARTGVAAVHSLVASGATVKAWDDGETARMQAESCLVDLYKDDFDSMDALLLAPGVPTDFPSPHPLVTKARDANVSIISDIDVFQSARETLPKHKTVAVTGTNGKSTTTALIEHMIRELGRPSVMGGNIGTGVLAIDALKKKGVYVLELSSFQLEITSEFDADVAVLLNITPDHLDRHGSLDGYIAAKEKLFSLQSPKGIAVICVDDQPCQTIAASCEQRVVPISTTRRVEAGVYVEKAVLFDAIEGEPVQVGNLGECITLQGEHNWQNAAAAYATGRALGFKSHKIFESLKSFPGLAHRQEILPFDDEIKVVNDSKATNVDAAVRGLRSFKNIRWIAGGRAKDKNFDGFASETSHVTKAYLMGEHGGLIADALPPETDKALFATMKQAFDAALSEAKPKDTILLSPACTAFDQFADFEKRGDAFRSIVADAKEQGS